MTQASLFDQPDYASGKAAGFARGSASSAEGAARANATLGDRQSAVYRVIVSRGGAALFEVQQALNIESANWLSGRITELKLQGLVRDSGVKRKNPKTNIGCTVWVAATPAQVIEYTQQHGSNGLEHEPQTDRRSA